MSDVQSRTVVETRVEYSLRIPNDIAQLEQLTKAARRSAELDGIYPYDDSIMVKSLDDELILWYVKPKDE